ncbi:NYN domain-containing protein [Leptolyngbya sp. BL0902]|uniref:NYN domain-containing protein n=1 Tax=Leptolyngbya sp. BL0902 TaxID=1115757 RepID=UPI0018E77845|nr:NYN domain-containing protein [Leptolyngbya sp. BL0902]QQE65710.1 NYN domain-containing protein [Leptolyngbya sp. BL0902]
MSAQVISIQRNCSTVAVAVDGQNIDLLKNGDAILKIASTFGTVSIRWAYHDWRKWKLNRQKTIQNQGWQCLDVADRSKNGLDRFMMADCRQLCASHPPSILVLATNDGDFAPLVKELLAQRIKVIVIGRRNDMSKQLRQLLPKGIVYIEDLKKNALSKLEIALGKTILSLAWS